MKAVQSGVGVPKPVGAYSPAIQANGFIFCAGQIALHPESGEMVGTDIETQTAQVLKNIDALLRAAGSSWHHVVMTTTFLTEIANGKVVNELYSKVVNPSAPPARQTVAVKALPLGAIVEISVIAVPA